MFPINDAQISGKNFRAKTIIRKLGTPHFGKINFDTDSRQKENKTFDSDPGFLDF